MTHFSVSTNEAKMLTDPACIAIHGVLDQYNCIFHMNYRSNSSKSSSPMVSMLLLPNDTPPSPNPLDAGAWNTATFKSSSSSSSSSSKS
mmetsp:Transcript_3779/g.14336  ORF Transcript_3779/g.14336 Transcript_3779/m.14336 type:complete len:89 (-) Transcript_3779:2988-3254(-)